MSYGCLHVDSPFFLAEACDLLYLVINLFLLLCLVMTVFGKQVIDNVPTEGHHGNIGPSRLCGGLSRPRHLFARCRGGRVLCPQTTDHCSVRPIWGS